MRIRTFIICIFILFFISSNGQQDRIKYARLSVEEGLSQSSAFAIAHDSVGYIWIGTYDGLNRYSGYDIKTFRHSKGNDSSLSDNYIQALCVDYTGKVWVGTNSKGLCIFSHEFEKFIRIPKASESTIGLVGESILTIKVLDAETIVVLTDKAINLVDTRTYSCKQVDEQEYEALKNTKSLVSYFNKDTSDSLVVSCYLNDSKGDSWKGTNKGLFRKAKGSNTWKIYKNELFDPNSLSSNDITSLMEDRGGVIWVGTSLGGVCRWDRLNEGILLYRNNPVYKNSLSHNKIRSFYEDSEGRVWIGTVAGGLNLWNRKEDNFKHWNVEGGVGLKSNHIREVIEWKGKYIVATNGAGLQTFNPNNESLQFSDLPIEGMTPFANVWDIEVVNEELWIATNDQGLFSLKDGKTKHYKKEIPTKKITWVTSDNENNIWVATFGDGLYCITSGEVKHWNTENSELSDDRIYSIVIDNNSMWLGTKGGVNHYDLTTQKFKSYSLIDGLPNETVMGIIPDKNDGIWISTNRGICHLMLSENSVVNYDINDGLQNNEFLVHSFLGLSSGEMLFGGINGFNVISEQGLNANPYPPQIVFTRFEVGTNDWFSDTAINALKIIELEYYQNEFEFEFAALGYAGVENNTYMYIMEGFDDNWKESGTRRFAQYTNLPNGKYTFKVKAANNDGIWNEVPATVKLIIRPAYWQTIWFKVLIGISAIVLLFIVYKMRMRQMQKRNRILEEEVTIRTKEVVEQKQEIEDKNHQIEEAFNDIQDSIMYAKRIQYAILPPSKLIKEHLPDSFVLFKPKDIVAGDFYWMETTKKGEVLIAAADCTGHGVPGAMVSVVCNNALNRSVREYGLTLPGEILDKTREIVIAEFEKSEEDVKDGMDIALCRLAFLNKNTSTNESKQPAAMLYYAGAHNPLWIVRNGELLETKATKQPIGKFDRQTPFTTHEIPLQKGDVVYLFSDGYADQFGGVKGKKFKSKAFKQLVIDINIEPMQIQKKLINESFNNWKGSLEQLDDVCVIGVKV